MRPAGFLARSSSAVALLFCGNLRQFDAAPNESAILNFRHLLEQHDLCGKLLDSVNWYLDSKGIRIARGTIVDAAIIAAPSSTRNSKKERDPPMQQTKRGNQYYNGAKAHIGVDRKEGVVHSVCTSAASKRTFTLGIAARMRNRSRRAPTLNTEQIRT